MALSLRDAGSSHRATRWAMHSESGGHADGAPVQACYAYAARYRYSEVVVHNDNFVMVSPSTDRYQAAQGSAIETRPGGDEILFSDRFGNTVHRVRVDVPHRQLVIAVVGVASLGGPPQSIEDAPVSSAYGPGLRQFLAPSPLVDPASVAGEAKTVAGGADSLLGAVHAVVEWVNENVEYVRGTTSVYTTAAEVLASMRGVCQDKTHLALGMLRSLGIPSRYASGLLTRQPGETHAWLEFMHPREGWLPADPTQGVVLETGADYLKFAVGRDYSEVPPVSGSFLSRGLGGLDVAMGRVYFDRDEVSFEDAVALIEPSGSYSS